MNDASANETLSLLNSRLAIPGVAQIVAGSGGMPKVQITTAACSAEIYLHGAQVTSWQPAGAKEVLFLSQLSKWEDGRAIRGGIPICFPWFRSKADDPKAPAHGFVRTRQWQLDSITEQDGSVVVILSTESDEFTRRWWPGEFRLQHKITAGPTLKLELTTTNSGATPFTIEEALHTYFNVGEAQSVSVRGLDRVHYLDNTDSNREKVQAGDITFSKTTDNAYLGTQGPLELIDPAFGRTILTEKENSDSTVVWNPWQQGAASFSDFGNDEWPNMTCVEACNILAAAVEIPPGEQHTMFVTLSVKAK